MPAQPTIGVELVVDVCVHDVALGLAFAVPMTSVRGVEGVLDAVRLLLQIRATRTIPPPDGR